MGGGKGCVALSAAPFAARSQRFPSPSTCTCLRYLLEAEFAIEGLLKSLAGLANRSPAKFGSPGRRGFEEIPTEFARGHSERAASDFWAPPPPEEGQARTVATIGATI
jgi:hypothetical protein